MAENHYVQIIHGTWSPPSTQEPRWHQTSSTDPDNFSNRLNALLGEYGMPNAVWRKWGEGDSGFGWSGANQHAHRIEAGERLFKTWLDLLKQDPAGRIHIVAHSHGANVTLSALEWYLYYLENQALDVYIRVLNAEPSEAIFAEMFGEQATIVQAQTRNILDALKRRALDPHRDHTSRFEDGVWWDLRRVWVGSRCTNRIGALVFLGAPFYRKVWKRTYWWSPGNMIRAIVDAAVSFPAAIIIAYVMAMICWGISWVLLLPVASVLGYGRFYDPLVNPVGWPTWLLIPVGIIGFFLGLFFFGYLATKFRKHLAACSDEAS
jgi:hypothetical protein